jgi:hypothetical protein
VEWRIDFTVERSDCAEVYGPKYSAPSFWTRRE